MTLQRHEVETAVKGLLAPNEEAWRKDIHDGYKGVAENQLASFNKFWSTKTPESRFSSYSNNPDEQPPRASFIRHPHNVPGAYKLHRDYGDKIHAAQNGTATIDHTAVKAQADAHYQQLHDQFVARATDKIMGIAGPKGVSKVSGSIAHRRALEGSITAHIDDKNHFSLNAEVKTNYRYGENAADGHITQYAQYPFTVTSAHVDGQHVGAPGADELATKYGGRSMSEVEQEKKATNKNAKAAWSSKKDELERKVDSWREVHDTVHNYAKQAEEHAATDPSHPGHAKLKKAYDKSVAYTQSLNPHWKTEPVALSVAYPAPVPLTNKERYPAHKHLARLGLAEWPSPEHAKAQLAAARDELKAHKASKPVAESADSTASPSINWANHPVEGDEKEPLGLTPTNQEDGYNGRTSQPVSMKAQDFLALNPKRTTDFSHVKGHMAAGKPTAPPLLFLDHHPTDQGAFIVKDHEGRGRAMSAWSLGHENIPVQLRFPHEEGRNKYNKKGRDVRVYPDVRTGHNTATMIHVPPHPSVAEGRVDPASVRVATPCFLEGVEAAHEYKNAAGVNMKAVLAINPYIPGGSRGKEWAAGFTSVIPDAPTGVNESRNPTTRPGPQCPVCDQQTVYERHSDISEIICCPTCRSWLDMHEGKVVPMRAMRSEHTCPKCQSHDVRIREAHADTGMDEMEGRCNACKYCDEADKFATRRFVDNDVVEELRNEWKLEAQSGVNPLRKLARELTEDAKPAHTITSPHDGSTHPAEMVDGELKHTHNSEGSPIHPTAEGRANFHRWFGKSKVVDEHGRPKVMLHGTPSKEAFDSFDLKKSGKNTSADAGGIFFTDRHELADTFAHQQLPSDFSSHHVKLGDKGHVIKTYLKMEHPLDLRDGSDKTVNDLIHMDHAETGVKWPASRIRDEQHLPNTDLIKTRLPSNLQKLKNYGYDGLIAKVNPRHGGGLEHAVLDPKQVKSVENAGSFSPDSAKLRESLLARIDEVLGFHATPDKPAIMAQGFKSKNQLGVSTFGSAGADDGETVSFSRTREGAEHYAGAIRDMANVAQGKVESHDFHHLLTKYGTDKASWRAAVEPAIASHLRGLGTGLNDAHEAAHHIAHHLAGTESERPYASNYQVPEAELPKLMTMGLQKAALVPAASRHGRFPWMVMSKGLDAFHARFSAIKPEHVGVVTAELGQHSHHPGEDEMRALPHHVVIKADA